MTDKSFPASAITRVPLALMLSGLAGCADAIGFLEFSQLFMSFMSGNTTRFGAAVAQGEWDGATRVASVIAVFCLGAFAGTLVAAWAGRWRLPVLLWLQAALLCLGLGMPEGPVPFPFHVYPVVLALGMQNATLQDADGRSLALTYVTGAVVRFGTGLANLLLHKPADSFWIQAPLWGALSSGAVVGGVLHTYFGEAAFLFTAALAAGLALAVTVLTLAKPGSRLIAGTAPAPDAPADAVPVTVVRERATAPS